MIILNDIINYQPYNFQEKKDKEMILDFINNNPQAFLRESRIAHLTASSWIVNKDWTKVLMVYHNIYNSWSWTGGHADGDEDLLRVAIKEAKEETGLINIKPVSKEIYSIEALTVDGHFKKGEYVSSHLHFNVTYLLEADENDDIKPLLSENKGVKWIKLTDINREVNEEWFKNNIYNKLNKKLILFKKGQ